MSIDFEAEGLLDGVEGEQARAARRNLLEDLAEEGVPLEELKDAVAADRLALLPLERVLIGPGERFTAEEVAERTNVPPDRLIRYRRALGLPIPEPDERIFVQEDIDAVELDDRFAEAGLPEEGRLDVARVIGRSMAQVAAATRDLVADALARPGDTERDLGLRYADAARAMVPNVAPLLEFAFAAQLRDLIRQEVIAQTDLASREVRGAVRVAVCFADLVGFTRLGESLSPEELDSVVSRLGGLAAEAAQPPVRLVKMIGDAAMLVSREPEALVEAALALVDAAGAQGEDFPELRAGVALGDALGRGGDFFGRPVNLASRLTGIARPGSVLASREVRDELDDRFRWSSAGRRRIKGLKGETPVFRVRRRAEQEDGGSDEEAADRGDQDR